MLVRSSINLENNLKSTMVYYRNELLKNEKRRAGQKHCVYDEYVQDTYNHLHAIHPYITGHLASLSSGHVQFQK